MKPCCYIGAPSLHVRFVMTIAFCNMRDASNYSSLCLNFSVSGKHEHVDSAGLDEEAAFKLASRLLQLLAVSCERRLAKATPQQLVQSYSNGFSVSSQPIVRCASFLVSLS